MQKALDAIHGVDLNPFAVAIARFRLIVAALKASGMTSLEAAPNFKLHLAAGDSLLHGSQQQELDLGDSGRDATLSGFAYATEDLHALRSILTPGTLRRRGRQPALHHRQGQEAQRRLPRALFDLQGHVRADRALHGAVLPARQAGEWRPSGRVDGPDHLELVHEARVRVSGSSRISSSKQDLRLVVDTSGAYIPGHGTPTVILVGRAATSE